MQVKIVVVILCCAISLAVGEHYFTTDGRQYFMSYPKKLSWYQALRYCTYNGMYLVDVRNSLENDRILTLIDKVNLYYNVSYTEYWTSGTDQGKEGDYYWATTGHPLLYENWLSSEPSQSPNEHCIHYTRTARQWNDAPCHLTKSFICRDYFDVPMQRMSECSNLGSL